MSTFFSTGTTARERANVGPRVSVPPPVEDERLYHELVAQRPALLDEKVKLHAKIIDEFNLAVLERMPREELVKELRVYVGEYVRTEKIPLNQREMQAFVEDLVDEMIGFGPIEPLLKDPTITDILINTHKKCFVERFGKLEETTVHFKDEGHLLRIIHKIVAAVGRRVDESSPTVDARLPDGSRVNVAIRPIAVDGPLVSIRKFSKMPFSMDRLIELGALRLPIAEVLQAAVHGRISMIISGGTGSGKTTLLNALSGHIPPDERIITIEDAAELQLQLPHVGRLETRPANAEGKGELRQRELVKNALRMRPDRIIIGECRGDEAFDMLQAMNTGHGASMTIASVRSQIASAVRVIVQLQRLPDGSRRVTSVCEITGMEGEVLQMQELYKFVKESTDERGVIRGNFRATGIRPVFLTDLKHAGIDLPASYFDPTRPL